MPTSSWARLGLVATSLMLAPSAVQASYDNVKSLISKFAEKNVQLQPALVNLTTPDGTDLDWSFVVTCEIRVELDRFSIGYGTFLPTYRRHCWTSRPCANEDVDVEQTYQLCRRQMTDTGYCETKCRLQTSCRRKKPITKLFKILKEHPDAILNYPRRYPERVKYEAPDNLYCSVPDTVTPFAEHQDATQLLSDFNYYAQHSAAAYCNSEKEAGQSIECEKDNCPDVSKKKLRLTHTFSDGPGDLNGYIAVDHDKKTIVVSFRGSWSLRNWLYDFRITFSDCEFVPECRVHTGFLKAWLGVEEDVTRLVKTVQSQTGYSIVTTGHSLGGAVATLAAAHMRYRGVNVTGYTYGSPRTGNQAFVNYASSQVNGTIHRVTHGADTIVLSPYVWMGYVHTSPEYWVAAGTFDTQYNASQISVCTGIANPLCSMSTWGLNLLAHFFYFRKIDACSSTLPGFKRDVVGDSVEAAKAMALPADWKKKQQEDLDKAKEQHVLRKLRENDCEFTEEETFEEQGNTFARAVVRKCAETVQVIDDPEQDSSWKSPNDEDDDDDESGEQPEPAATTSQPAPETPEPTPALIWAEEDDDETYKQCRKVLPDNPCVRELFYYKGSTEYLERSCRIGDYTQDMTRVEAALFPSDLFPGGPKCGDVQQENGKTLRVLNKESHFGPICDLCFNLPPEKQEPVGPKKPSRKEIWAEANGGDEKFKQCQKLLPEKAECAREIFFLKGSSGAVHHGCRSGDLADKWLRVPRHLYPADEFPDGPLCGEARTNYWTRQESVYLYKVDDYGSICSRCFPEEEKAPPRPEPPRDEPGPTQIWAEQEGDKTFAKCQRRFPDDVCVREIFHTDGSVAEVVQMCKERASIVYSAEEIGTARFPDAMFPDGPRCGYLTVSGGREVMRRRKRHHVNTCECVGITVKVED